MPSCLFASPIRALRSLPALAPALLSALLLVVSSGCASGTKSTPAAPAAMRAAPTRQAAHDLQYTATSEIRFDGELVGYLVDVLPVPEGIIDSRPWEPGTALIQDLRFQFIGFVSPRGTTSRFDPDGNPRKVGFGSRIDGIAAFFKRNGKPQFVSLHPGTAAAGGTSAEAAAAATTPGP